MSIEITDLIKCIRRIGIHPPSLSDSDEIYEIYRSYEDIYRFASQDDVNEKIVPAIYGMVRMSLSDNTIVKEIEKKRLWFTAMAEIDELKAEIKAAENRIEEIRKEFKGEL